MAKRGLGEVHVRKPKGGKCYTAYFYAHGRRYDIGTGQTTRAEAIRVGLAAQELKLRQQPTNDTELRLLLDKWLADLEAIRSPGWCLRLEVIAKLHWLTRWDSLSSLTSVSIQKYITDRMVSVSSVTILKELAGLRSFLRWCVAGRLMVEIPVWTPPKKVTDHQPIYLTPEQVQMILATMQGKGRDYVEFLWETGLRTGTVAAIEWRDVDLTAKTLTIRASIDKNRYGRTVPLSDKAVECLARQSREGERPFKKIDTRRAIHTACVKLGLAKKEDNPRIGHRVFRHSRSTNLAGKTTNVAALMYILGHKSIETTRKYIHPGFEEAKELITK